MFSYIYILGYFSVLASTYAPSLFLIQSAHICPFALLTPWLFSLYLQLSR